MEERRGTHQGVQMFTYCRLRGAARRDAPRTPSPTPPHRIVPFPLPLPAPWTMYEHSNPVGNVGPDQYENRDDLPEPY